MVVIKVTFVNGAAIEIPTHRWSWTDEHPGFHPALLTIHHALQPDLHPGSRYEIPFYQVLFVEVLISADSNSDQADDSADL